MIRSIWSHTNTLPSNQAISENSFDQRYAGEASLMIRFWYYCNIYQKKEKKFLKNKVGKKLRYKIRVYVARNAYRVNLTNAIVPFFDHLLSQILPWQLSWDGRYRWPTTTPPCNSSVRQIIDSLGKSPLGSVSRPVGLKFSAISEEPGVALLFS